MKNQCNGDEISINLQYLDAKNLYKQSMIQKLPTHAFAWEEKFIDVTPTKIRLSGEETQGFIYLRTWCRVSQAASQEA